MTIPQKIWPWCKWACGWKFSQVRHHIQVTCHHLSLWLSYCIRPDSLAKTRRSPEVMPCLKGWRFFTCAIFIIVSVTWLPRVVGKLLRPTSNLLHWKGRMGGMNMLSSGAQCMIIYKQVTLCSVLETRMCFPSSKYPKLFSTRISRNRTQVISCMMIQSYHLV